MKPFFIVLAVLCIAYISQSCGNANGKANDAISAELKAQTENANTLLRKSDLQPIFQHQIPRGTLVKIHN